MASTSLWSSWLGGLVELPEAQFQQPVGSSACPAHALAFEAAADGEINVLLDSTRSFHTHHPRLGGELRAQRAGAIETSLIGLQIPEESFDPLGIADAIELGQTNGGNNLVAFTAVERLF